MVTEDLHAVQGNVCHVLIIWEFSLL